MKENLLAPGTKFALYRHRENDLLSFFSMDADFVYCYDVKGFIAAMKCEYNPEDWRLFIDSSKKSCVLLCNVNVLASIPIGHLVMFKNYCTIICTTSLKVLEQ